MNLRAQIAILAVACLIPAVDGCNRDSTTRVKIELRDPPASQKAAAAATTPRCPPAGSPMLQPSASTGHHKVTLSWNASAPGTRPEDNAVGYCLYRSKTKDAAKKDATCSNCEQINLVPVAGTGCVDDLVQDGAAYFYVATAINAEGQLSSSSNEISVLVPATKQSPNAQPSSLPLCRASSPLH